jgi:hypothetical protein
MVFSRLVILVWPNFMALLIEFIHIKLLPGGTGKIVFHKKINVKKNKFYLLSFKHKTTTIRYWVGKLPHKVVKGSAK